LKVTEVQNIFYQRPYEA